MVVVILFWLVWGFCGSCRFCPLSLAVFLGWGGVARGRLACLNFGVVCRCPFGGCVCCGRFVGCGCDGRLWLVGVVGLSVGGWRGLL